MPDMKLSQLVDGAPALAADLLYLARAGGLSRSISITGLFSNIPVNVGVGVGTRAWGANFRMIDFQSEGGIGTGLTNSTYVGQNWYYDTASKYIGNGFALIYEQNKQLGKHLWYLAPNNGGGAGAAATLSEALSLTASSLFIGPSNSFGERLNVAGRISIGTGTSQNDSEVRFLNYASQTCAWNIAIRQDIGGANNDLKFVRFDGSGTFQGVAAQINQANGYVGIGMAPTVQFELSGSVGQKASGTTWSNPSDARVKENIAPADLNRCYEIVKAIPLKRYTLKREAFSNERVSDRSKLGWIAQEVQPLFAKAVKAHTFQMEPVPDGFEEVDEPVLEEAAPAEEAYVEIIDGVPVQKTRVVAKSVPVVDMVPLTDEQGNPVLEDVEEPVELDGVQMLDGAGAPLTKTTKRQVMHPVPRMRKVQRAKVRRPEIPDCLALDADQIYAAMYGTVQRLIQKVEALEAQLASK